MKKANKRHERILAIVATEGEVSVTKLSQLLGVSVMTIRRDLAYLSRAEKINRTHGGATVSRRGILEFEFYERAETNLPAKQAIARVIAEMVKPGMAIVIDTGTTTLEVAKRLTGIRNLTVLTTSLAIVSELQSNESTELILLGGIVRRNSPDLTGSLTEENLKRFRTHIAIIGADAVSRDYTYANNPESARVCQAMVQNTEKTILAVDSSKFSKTAFARCLPLSEVDVIVTDDACPEEVRTWLLKTGAEVIFATVKKNK